MNMRMGQWGGAERINTLVQFTKDHTLSNGSGALKVKRHDYAVAYKHSGDGFFDWIIVTKNKDDNYQVKAIFGSYWVACSEVLGQITNASLYSLLNDYYNRYPAAPYIAHWPIEGEHDD